jgi:leucyl aminopeptidase
MLKVAQTSALFLLFTLSAHAENIHTVVAPTCLTKNMSVAHRVLSTTHNFALIETNAKGIDQLADAKHSAKNTCGGFIDVTTDWKASKSNAISFLTTQTTQPNHLLLQHANYKIQYAAQVNPLLASVNPQDMWSNLTTLSSFPDRHASTDNGVKAANWIKTQIESVAKNAGRNDVTAYFVATGTNYKQPSLVVKVGTSNEAGVVIGAHMDTVKSSFENRPGADDDGSGSATTMEVARNIISSGMHFKKPIYFVWYSAEELGLVGSQYVVKDFVAKNIPVTGVMHFDMTGFAHQNEPTMWVMDDFVNKDLTTFVESLIKTYVKQPVKHSRCGYACSDHASWTKAGFAATIPAEAAYEDTNPAMHSAQDTMDKLSLNHMTDYAKLGTAFAVELAEPSV